MKAILQTAGFLALAGAWFIGIAIHDARDERYHPIKELREKGVPADEWFEQQRAFPFDEIPNAEYLKAVQFIQREIQTNRPATGPVWQLAGPTNIEGRISTIAIDPTNPLIVYAGCANGGVWKSTDFCHRWVSVFDYQSTSSIGALAIDPSNSSVIYCGTGEANSLRSYYPGTGLYKSTDAGNTWQLIALPNSYSIGNIAINPQDTREVYVAAVGSLRHNSTERGIFRSTDAGVTWSQSLFVADSVGAIDVVIDPQNPNRIFAAMWERMRREDRIKYGGPQSALYHSTDRGGSWFVIAGSFPSGQSDLGRISIDIALSDPPTVYALTAYASGTSRGLYKSTDGGASWKANSSVAFSSNYAWFNRICRVDPSNSDHVFCGGLSMSVSTDGGSTFVGGVDHHVDQHAVAFAPSDPRFIVMGNDGGIEYSTNSGSTWQDSHVLPVTQFYAGEIDPSNPNVLLGGTQDNGTVRTLDGNLSTWTDIYGGDGFYCRVDYSNPLRVFASYQYGGLGYSTDGGNSFYDGTNGLDRTYANWMTPYVLDKNNPAILYCGTYKVFKSVNGMASWTAISPDLASPHVQQLGTITTIDVARTDPNVIYCGTDNAQVWVTTNGGGSWTSVNTGLPSRWVTRVTIHPDSANICYVTLSGYKVDSTGSHIYRTTNYGATWTSIRGNLPDAPINDVIIDPLNTSQLYIATDIGVMCTSDLGSTWSVFGAGLPTFVPCHDLTFHEPTRMLVVWTHGRSAWKTAVPFPVNVPPLMAGVPKEAWLGQNYPNPFNPTTNIEIRILKFEFVSLKVYDIVGREVAVLVNEPTAAGEYTVRWDASGNASGVYIARLAAGKSSVVRKMLLVR